MAGNILSFRGLAPRLAEDCFIAEGATVIGDVTVGAGSSIWYGCVLRGDVNSITIGARSNIQDGTVIHVNAAPGDDYRVSGGGMRTVIGDDVTVGHMALIHACTLEDGAFVGMRAVVMDEAVVEGGAMVAAGALVTPGKRVKRGELWAGSPAKPLRAITPEEAAFFANTATRYAGYAQLHRQEAVKLGS